jgi:hypothetical protein
MHPMGERIRQMTYLPSTHDSGRGPGLYVISLIRRREPMSTVLNG